MLIAGGGDDAGAVNETQAEIYSPPYLFKGTRPSILSGPDLIQYGVAFQVTTEDANARRVAVFRTISGKRQAAAFDLTSIRRGEAPDPEIFPGDIIVVDGSRVKAVQKQILQSIPLLAIFGPL